MFNAFMLNAIQRNTHCDRRPFGARLFWVISHDRSIEMRCVGAIRKKQHK